MLIGDYNTKPESYSSYKKRFFNKYSEKARMILKGIHDTSLTSQDKKKLKNQLTEIFKSEAERD